ncbi:MAG TPA: DUF4340 domain-containing protein, partial [Candidatus Competibacteraceae bacterium]|nr:DUF4340 domain-containing protein [Candidatus Competibacteraceae bacterium]
VKPIIVVLALALIAIAAMLWMNRSPEPLLLTGQALVPELQQNINQVTGLRISKAGNRIVADLKRTEQGWVMINKGNYPANTNKIREVLLLLANTQLVEEKTTVPENYMRQGAQPSEATGVSGTEVAIEMPAGPVSWIIGKTSGSGGGTYVRRPDSSQSFLVNSTLAIPGDVKDWLERGVLDIPASRIQAITIRQPGGDTLLVEKQARGQANFSVSGLPPEHSLKSDTVANALGNGLAGLWLEDVTPVGSLQPGQDKITTADYRTFDGLKITARTFEANGRHYAHFDVNVDENQAGRSAEPATTTGAAGQPADNNPITARDEANRLKARLSPWIFAISSYKYDILSRRMEDLLKPAQAEEQEQEVPAAAQSEPEATTEAGEDAESPSEPDSDATEAPPGADEDAAPSEEGPPASDATEAPPGADEDAVPSEEEPPSEPDSEAAPEPPGTDEDLGPPTEPEPDSEAEPVPER